MMVTGGLDWNSQFHVEPDHPPGSEPRGLRDGMGEAVSCGSPKETSDRTWDVRKVFPKEVITNLIFEGSTGIGTR